MEFLHPILDPLNRLIIAAADAGVNNLIYELWNIINLTVVSVFCLIYRRHYDIKAGHALLIPLIGYFVGDAFILLLGWIANGFQYFGSNNIVKGFSFFPLIGLIPMKLFKIEWKKVMDYAAPAFPLLQFTAHFACNFAGCCCGYPMEYGIWNPTWELYLFPAQLLESFVSLLIFFACLIFARSQKFKVTGHVYPFFLITFGVTRFFLEFLRCNSKVFWGISDLALWALLMVVVGVGWLIIDHKNTLKNAQKEAA